MKKSIFASLLIASITLYANTVTLAQSTFTASAKESRLTWHGSRVAYEHSGSVSLKSGTLQIQKSKVVGGEFVIDMTSIRDLDIEDEQKSGKLTNHLKSDDFFDVENFPTSTIKITGAKGSTITADLTIKGVTQPITFEAAINVDEDKLFASTELTFDRSQFGVKYGSNSFFDNLGDKAIYNDIKLEVEILAYNLVD
jgi:polyisoprenoid-binding protein YceI